MVIVDDLQLHKFNKAVITPPLLSNNHYQHAKYHQIQQLRMLVLFLHEFLLFILKRLCPFSWSKYSNISAEM